MPWQSAETRSRPVVAIDRQKPSANALRLMGLLHGGTEERRGSVRELIQFESLIGLCSCASMDMLV
jgi:hypothetical protein